MAILFKGKLPKAGLTKVVFSLPTGRSIIEPKADVAWADGSGRAGIRFTEMAASSREELDAWLEQQIEQADQLSK